jgi:shikimate 5-dehydrogenase
MAPKTFAVATTVQDPLSAERLVDALQAGGLDAFVRTGGAASSAAFAAAQSAFYDVLVPSESFEKASALIREVLELIERDAEANAQAAEAEAMSGEHERG